MTDLCTYGWEGCDGNYTGGHYCERIARHNGRHRCECGATSSATWIEPAGKAPSTEAPS